MQIQYDEDLVESAVFLCMNGKRAGIASLQIARAQRQREKLYSILDPEERSAAFYRFHLAWFREWELENALIGMLPEFPSVNSLLETLVFRRAIGRNDEGAELYVNAESRRHAVVAMRAERFATHPRSRRGNEAEGSRQHDGAESSRRGNEADPLPSDGRGWPTGRERVSTLESFLRHEYTHLNDMLDPAFGYSPFTSRSALNPAQERLTRERYRLLWDITIDGRITKSTCAWPETRDSHQKLFDRTFNFWNESRRREIFDRLWNCAEPRHSELMSLAEDPRAVHDSREPVPGGACPLCRFATFEWAPPDELRELRSRIAAEFPDWSPEQGACQRCVEIFGVAPAQSKAVV